MSVAALGGTPGALHSSSRLPVAGDHVDVGSNAMLEENEALRRILEAVIPAQSETLDLATALGRFAARGHFATMAQPPFDNSAMDGYALHADDCGKAPWTVRVAGEQPAGFDRGLTVRPGECARVFTGAPLPAGTGAVVMQEDTDRNAEEGTVTIREAAAPGEFIRRRGGDLCAGQVILRAGDRITPQRIAALAGQGLARVECGRAPRVRVLTTGDELVPAGEALTAAGQIYNSNGPMLAALFTQAGAAAAAEHSPDDLEILTDTIRRAAADSDFLVLAGGVSVGDHDYVKPALASLGAEPEFWRVRLKPGKPFLFTRAGKTMVFGLPGNPASALVTAVLFVLPALRRFAGAAEEDCAPPRIPARLEVPLSNPGDRPHYFRGRFDFASASFAPAGRQESHAVFGLSQSNALLRLEPGESAEAGQGKAAVLF